MSQRLAGLLRVGDLLVVAGEVAHPQLTHQLVAPLHLADAPVQRVRRELHVGDHRRQQMRNALVDRQLEHLRVDQDHAHFARLGLVEQRKDHRVHRDRLAGPGRAGDQQVRHPRQIHDHRPSGDVLAERERQPPGRIVVRRRRQDLDQAHDLTLRVRQLERHAGLAGNRLDDANADDRQRPRQVLHEIDDLRALHADGRLDLEARDHRARIRRQHPHLHAEVRELALDQAGRELERLGAHRLRCGRRVLEQRQRRQRRIRHVGEQRSLLFLHDALGPGHGRDRRQRRRSARAAPPPRACARSARRARASLARRCGGPPAPPASRAPTRSSRRCARRCAPSS